MTLAPVIVYIAVFLAIMAVAWFIVVTVSVRIKKESAPATDADKSDAKGGITENIKKAIALRPSWLVMVATVGG